MTTNGTISQRKLVGYATNLEISDGDSAYDTLAEVAALIEAGTASASFHLIWQMTIPAQQIIRWGSGSANQQRNQGFMSFNALDVGTGFGSKHAAAPHGNHNFDRSRAHRYQQYGGSTGAAWVSRRW